MQIFRTPFFDTYFKLFHNTIANSIPLSVIFNLSVGFEINYTLLNIVPFVSIFNKGGIGMY